MKKMLELVLVFTLLFAETAFAQENQVFEETQISETGLELSDMAVRITSQEHTAVFQLYETEAAEELYEQLPLELELSNFADAQRMFYPPEELDVTDAEIYKDGKKGELSYYEPWGDIFMLYEDFQSGDDMHRLGVCLEGVDEIAEMSGDVLIEQDPSVLEDTAEESMQIRVEAEAGEIIFELNDSRAARDLYEQLPLTIEVEDYSTNEKIFYPPEELNTEDTPQAEAGAGTLAYYEPWGDVVMFYGDFGSTSGLYELGQVVSGSELISELSGTIQVEGEPGESE